ncbi:MAG: cell division protein ZapA [Spirochaetia bacterium]|nr:cell division protein ZapA [Spirochaetia bacterium]
MSFEKSKSISKAKVEISGKNYTLLGDVDAEYMLSVAKYVNEKYNDLKNNTKETEREKLILLAALNIADELMQLKSQVDNIKAGSEDSTLGELGEKTNNLISILEEGLIGKISA